MILSLGPSCWAWWSQFLVEDVLKPPISLLKTRSQRIWPCFFSAKCWDGPMTFHRDKWIVVHSHSYHSWSYFVAVATTRAKRVAEMSRARFLIMEHGFRKLPIYRCVIWGFSIAIWNFRGVAFRGDSLGCSSALNKAKTRCCWEEPLSDNENPGLTGCLIGGFQFSS